MVEHQGEHPSQWAAICSIANKFGISHETLRNWVRRAQVDDGRRPGLTSDERERLQVLERENRELRRANGILKRRLGFLGGGARPPTQQMIAYLDARRNRLGVEPICRVLPIAPSTYYRASRPLSARRRHDQQLKVEIRRVYDDNFGVYGAAALKDPSLR